MSAIQLIIEPDILIERIARMMNRRDDEIPEDSIGIEARVSKVRQLSLAFPGPSVTYEAKRERVVTMQNELLELARFGGEQEALGLATVFSQVYLELIPPEMRGIEYQRRLQIE